MELSGRLKTRKIFALLKVEKINGSSPEKQEKGFFLKILHLFIPITAWSWKL